MWRDEKSRSLTRADFAIIAGRAATRGDAHRGLYHVAPIALRSHCARVEGEGARDRTPYPALHSDGRLSSRLARARGMHYDRQRLFARRV